MKRTLLALAISILSVAAVPQATAQVDVSVNLFYDNLQGGSWIELDPYGYCWQPDVAANDPTWRPYADGYWAYTDDGWTWVSYEDFGWATYHYGRWTRLSDYGWVWVPGQEWAPAWVSWRTGGSYIGWAPLPPETERIYESRPLTGHLDIEFDIGPACYIFVDVRYIGEPVLRSRIVPVQQNVTYITQTVNVTNITYKNKTVYSYGPDVNVVNQYSSRPIQRLRLERQQNVDLSAAAKSGGLTKVQGNALVVAAPIRVSKPAQPIAPPQVKAKVTQAKIERGWSVAGDSNAQTQLKEKLKTQTRENVAPLSATAPAGGANASPGASAPAMSTSVPFERGKGRAAGQFQPGASAVPSAAASAAPTAEFGKGRKGRPIEPTQAGPTVPPGASATVSPAAGAETGKGRKGKVREQFGQPPVTGPSVKPEASATAPIKPNRNKNFEVQPGTTGSRAATEGPVTTPRPDHKAKGGFPPSPAPTTSQSENLPPQGGKHKQQGINQPAFAAPGSQPGGQNPPAGESEVGKQRKPKHEENVGQPGGAPAATNLNSSKSNAARTTGPNPPPTSAGEGQQGERGGKKKGEKSSPTPGPQ